MSEIILYRIKRKIKHILRNIILQNIHKLIFFSSHNIDFPKNMLFHSFDYIDLNNIIKIIKKHKPKTVLELGSGYSTYAIIYALMHVHKNNDFKFYSVDQTLDYQKHLMSEFPKNLKDKIIFQHRKVNIKEFKNTKMSFFDDLPNEKFDFIYEDRQDHPDTKIAGDILKYENEKIIENDKFVFIIDGMESTVNFYKNNLKFRYSYNHSSFAGISFTKL